MPKAEVTTSKIIQREIHYFENEVGRNKQNANASKCVSTINKKQLKVYNCVKETINKKKGCMVFVDATGGTCKTLLMNAFMSYMRNTCKIVLVSLFVGVAVMLLNGCSNIHTLYMINTYRAKQEFIKCYDMLRSYNSSEKHNVSNHGRCHDAR